MSEDHDRKVGIRGLDIVRISLILFAILWTIFFPSPKYAAIGHYSIAQLFPMVLGGAGLICVITARFKR